MHLIVAVDEQWGIGRNGELLCRISKDMKRFRAMTMGNVLVLGRKTLESFPNGKPLPDRSHVVLTKNTAYPATDVTLCHAVEDLPKILATFRDKEIFVAGGGSVYRQLLPLCESAFVTKIHAAFPADTTFPNLDEAPEWEKVAQSEIQEEKGVHFSFVEYRRRK